MAEEDPIATAGERLPEEPYETPEDEIRELRGRIRTAWTAFQFGDEATVAAILSCPFGGFLISFENVAFADVKAIFAADGTFNIGASGEVTL